MNVKYTITKFDNQAKIVVVAFEDGNWSEIRLRNPLPKNRAELEEVIKQFAIPKEFVEAVTAPDADLTFIDEMVGVEFETPRIVLNPNANNLPTTNLDEVTANDFEQKAFEKMLGEALVKFGVLQQDPNTIPVEVL